MTKKLFVWCSRLVGRKLDDTIFYLDVLSYFRAVSPSGPAGSIFSTASDMAKWMLFHLRKGRKGHGHGHVIVDPDYLEETYMSQVPHPFADKDLTKPTYPISDVSVSYNMGWMSSVYRGSSQLSITIFVWPIFRYTASLNFGYKAFHLFLYIVNTTRMSLNYKN